MYIYINTDNDKKKKKKKKGIYVEGSSGICETSRRAGRKYAQLNFSTPRRWRSRVWALPPTQTTPHRRRRRRSIYVGLNRAHCSLARPPACHRLFPLSTLSLSQACAEPSGGPVRSFVTTPSCSRALSLSLSHSIYHSTRRAFILCPAHDAVYIAGVQFLAKVLPGFFSPICIYFGNIYIF